ncbi:MAG: hypothetical protein PHO76_00720 [Methylotenera sp.]|nr:hypothetical protein [Methylotenera sp.]
MAESDSGKPIDPRNPLSKLDERVGMHLSFWAYPQPGIEKANKVAPYPEPWKQAEPGLGLPASWPVANQDVNGTLAKGSPEGWNTQHNAKTGKLENQFMVSINTKTHQITIDFKGSDATSNWVSDFTNAGASEFAKIQEKAQKAYDAIKANPDYKYYHYAVTGHSLGGGMAQSFALKNNLDAYVYNSLPIASDTINSDYFKDVGGYKAALKQYQDANHQVHDVRTPNDIATYNYDKFMQNQYLSGHVGAGPTMLPGSSMPASIKTALMLGGYTTPVATAIMGKDHTMGAMFNGQQGLAVGEAGRYSIPEGHQDFAQLTPEARKLFIKLSESPVVKAMQAPNSGGDISMTDKFEMKHEDGGMQHITVYRNSREIDIDYYDKDGKRTLVNIDRKGRATATEYDANNTTPIKTEKIGLYTDPLAQQPTNFAAQSETLKTENLAGVTKSPALVIRDQIAKNLANNPVFLSRSALMDSGEDVANSTPQAYTHSQQSSQVKSAEA